ncbi:cytochrome P450 [Melanogaster broomeanus]|nr:cytochrome P450 [Melanogaster broomeanus]
MSAVCGNASEASATMMTLHLFSVFLLILAFLLVYLKKKGSEGGRRQLPPGPCPTPILGNISGIDARYPWKTYTDWAAEYGEIIYTQLLGQVIIVISSERVARVLLDRRSHNYSSRPTSLIPINQLFGTEFSSIFLPYGDRWRLHRRLFHQAFNANAALSFRPIQMEKAHELIMNLLTTPDDFSAHMQALSISTIMAIVYDYKASSRQDPVVAYVETAIEIAMKEVRPEVAAVIGAFPFLKHLPPWFPGARFKRNALISQECAAKWIETPFQHVKKNMAAGTAAPSMVSDTLSRIQDTSQTEEDAAHMEKTAKEACASAYAAASETTFSTLSIFILAMIRYPDVQKRAQAEIDSVIGSDLTRLPAWEDRSSLPYIDAVIKETLRWHPVAPLGIPHATVDDDIYEGYFIPKGATVLANAWAMSRDPITYPQPNEFRPERFLASEKDNNGVPLDVPSFAFGFGRRVCVGRYVADASLWAAIASMLAVFRFEPTPGWDPGPEGQNVVWTEGVTTHPKFPCKITPRHKDLVHERLLQLVHVSA